MKISQLETPALYLELDAFDRNQKKMADRLKKHNIDMFPHYKSAKCTTIAHMQIAAGAKGISCAKADEAWDLAHSGIENILIANQVISLEKISRVAGLAGCCNLTVCVDEEKNIENLSAAASFHGTVIHCLVECNIGADRGGVNSKEEVLTLAKKIIESPGLNFDGIQAYAGQISHENDYKIREKVSLEIENYLKGVISYLEENNISVNRVTGVSTGTVQFRNADTVYTDVQVGSYAFMDVSYGKLGLEYENSLFVLSTVMETNDKFVIMDTGRKSVSVDQAMPQIPGFECEDISVSEEHIKLPADVLKAQVGDKISIIPGHCCTTMNLHDYIYFVRGNTIIDRVEITSRGRSG
ncbi:alanine racemase [Planococcus shenhongbingii]|uniref:Alanine racemase n=1 Tax=Planococcus shenhongbingii TaxID=3058398 RepID=A0ABT8NC75_9BACL|nr:alanine racemase [Planococcus sp. N017]MDN7245477.1 alanine racemase [Planococcus sp. N017]